MSKKSAKIAALIESCQGKDLSPHYLGFFECFNRGLYYEAHDVLEELWLPVRHELDGRFYQGLIQLAGAFVHLRKNRLGPAGALFVKARTNLSQYPDVHHSLRIGDALEMIDLWSERLKGAEKNPLGTETAPVLNVMPGTPT